MSGQAPGPMLEADPLTEAVDGTYKRGCHRWQWCSTGLPGAWAFHYAGAVAVLDNLPKSERKNWRVVDQAEMTAFVAAQAEVAR
jgi:hypothetical protein